MCQESHVTSHVSCVACHLSPVTCHLSITPTATATATDSSPATCYSPIIKRMLVCKDPRKQKMSKHHMSSKQQTSKNIYRYANTSDKSLLCLYYDCGLCLYYDCTKTVDCVLPMTVDCVCTMTVDCVYTKTVDCVCTMTVDCVYTKTVDCVCTMTVDFIYTKTVDCVCTTTVECVFSSFTSLVKVKAIFLGWVNLDYRWSYIGKGLPPTGLPCLDFYTSVFQL